MPKLPGISQQDAVRVFAKLGYVIQRQSGHVIMARGKDILVISRNRVINAFTMGGLAKQAGLTPEQFRDLL